MESWKRTIEILYSDIDMGTYKFAFIERTGDDEKDELRYAQVVRDELSYSGVTRCKVSVVGGKLFITPQTEEAAKKLSDFFAN